jgi:hypothetical protein
MPGEQQLGRLAVWSIHRDRDASRLLIDLDYGAGLEVTIDRAGSATAVLSDGLREQLANGDPDD